MDSVTFLFGSGVSLASGIPSMKTITECIETDDNVGGQGDGLYYLVGYQGYQKNTLSGISSFNVERIRALLTILKDEILSLFYLRFNSNHEINYEDYYFIVKQIRDSYLFEYENPLTIDIISKLENNHSDLLSQPSIPDFNFLCAETLRFIECIVWQKVDSTISTTDQFNILKGLREKFKIPYIVSLNHDLVLEDFFDKNGVSYFDGFRLNTAGLKEWEERIMEDSSEIKLLKLHGSVDWFSVTKNSSRPGDGQIITVKMPRGIHLSRLNEFHSSYNGWTFAPPTILVGTFNKLFAYINYQYLYNCFCKSLDQTECLVISGYGFGDKGINSPIVNWLNSEKSKRLIIIHPDITSLRTNARGAFNVSISSPIFGTNPKVRFIEKKFEKLKVEDVIKEI